MQDPQPQRPVAQVGTQVAVVPQKEGKGSTDTGAVAQGCSRCSEMELHDLSDARCKSPLPCQQRNHTFDRNSGQGFVGEPTEKAMRIWITNIGPHRLHLRI